MSHVHIVLDSTANVPQDMLQNWPNLHIVPLSVLIGDRQMPENELTAAELFRLIKETGCHPKTSQPPPGKFAELFSRFTQEGSSIIVITLSGSLSGTVQSAKTAALMTGSKDIYVVDSRTTAIGMVQMAEVALRLAQDGVPAKQIAQTIQTIAAHTYTMFVPGTLEYLHKGGRIGQAAALFGAILQIRPVLYLEEGRVAVLDKVRTRTRAITRMIDELSNHSQLAYLGIVHIEASEDAAELQRAMQVKYPHVPVLIGDAGPVLATHLGPGLVGVIFQEVC